MTVTRTSNWRGLKRPDKIVVVVGYTQNYALEVHERTDVPHRVGQAKFLETAARQAAPQIQQIMNGPGDVRTKLLRSGLLIQRMSQELTPVDTSALKASAFTSLEEEADAAATEARTVSEAIRAQVLAGRDKR